MSLLRNYYILLFFGWNRHGLLGFIFISSFLFVFLSLKFLFSNILEVLRTICSFYFFKFMHLLFHASKLCCVRIFNTGSIMNKTYLNCPSSISFSFLLLFWVYFVKNSIYIYFSVGLCLRTRTSMKFYFSANFFCFSFFCWPCPLFSASPNIPWQNQQQQQQ